MLRLAFDFIITGEKHARGRMLTIEEYQNKKSIYSNEGKVTEK